MYIRYLEHFAKSCDIYLPFLDEELRLFARYGLPFDHVVCSPFQTILLFTDKHAAWVALKNAGFNVPPPADVIFKPQYGRGGKNVFTSAAFGESLLVQQRLDGREFTIDVLTDRAGKFLFAVPRERAAANGVSTVGIIDMDDELIALAKRVTEKFTFAGPINIQVIMADDGNDYIIEINPRLSGSCIFTVMAGWDILDDTIGLIEGRAFVPPTEVKEITIRRHYVEEIL